MAEETDVKIAVKAEADEPSFRKAEERAKELVDTAEADSAPDRSEASARNAAEVEKERKEIEALRQQMALEAKGRAGLIKELERLGKARAKAAKAGDVATYKKLAEQMDKTRTAYEKLNQGLEISRLGMMGQMQVAMGAMGAMQSLGSELKNGEVSLMGVASATYAVGAAIKAGMGPIGWLMLAIQGLAMAWDWYSKKQEEAEVAEKQRRIAELENLQAQIEAVLKLATAERTAAFAQWEAGLERVKEHWAEVNKREAEAAQRAAIKAQGEEERRRIAAQAAYDQEAARVELAKTLGEISEQEAQRRLRAAEEIRIAELRAVDDAEARRTAAAHIAAKDRATREAQALEEELAKSYGKFDDVLKLKMPTSEEWDALQARFAAGLAGAEELAAKQHIRDNVQELRDLLAQMGIAWQGSDTELIKWVNSIRAAREAGEKRIEELKATARAEGAASVEIREQIETRRAQHKAEDETRAATRQIEDARLKSSQLALEWQEVQRRSLAEQAAWLEQTAASLASGSEEAKKWTDALRSVKLREVAEELNGLGEKFKVSGNYAEKDNRLQADIYAADERALKLRREALLRLKSAPHIDAATLKSINARLRETDAQTRGLRQAMRASAAAAQQAVVALKPLGQRARKGTLQGALRRSEEAFVRLARTAERQASRGDTRALNRTLEAMRRNALQQEKLSGYTGQAAARMREVEGNLRNVERGTAAQDRGLTAAQRRQNQVLESLGQERRYKARQSAAARRTARAQEREARETEKAARQASRDTPKRKAKSPARQIQELTGKLTEANKSLAEQKGEVLRLNSAIGTLASTAAAGMQAARAGADAANKRCSRLDKEVAALKAAVRNLRR